MVPVSGEAGESQEASGFVFPCGLCCVANEVLPARGRNVLEMRGRRKNSPFNLFAFRCMVWLPPTLSSCKDSIS